MIRCGFWEHSKALFLQREDKTEKPLQRGGMQRRRPNPELKSTAQEGCSWEDGPRTGGDGRRPEGP